MRSDIIKITESGGGNITEGALSTFFGFSVSPGFAGLIK